jgi:hypothetical protein
MDIEVQARKAAEVLGEEVVQGAIDKLVQIERERRLRQMEKLRDGIIAFESHFGKNSDQVWQDYQNGKLGDDADIMEWVMLIENLRTLKAQCDRMAEIQAR